MKTWTTRGIILVGVAAGWVLALPLVGQAQASPANDPASVLIAFEQAVGSGQGVDAALAVVADSAVLHIIPPPPGTTGVWTGKEQVRQGLAYAQAHHVQRQLVGSPKVSGTKVSAKALVTNDFFAQWGVAPVQHETDAVVVSGKLTSYTSTMAPAERARVGAAAAAYQRAHAAPASMPATGGTALNELIAGLVVLGLLGLGGGMLMRRGRRATF